MYSTLLSIPRTQHNLLPRIACHESGPADREQVVSEFHPLRLKWAVVNDTKGNRRLQMHWCICR